MKKEFFLILLLLQTIKMFGQAHLSKTSANYEAAKWQLKLIDHPEKIIISAPPNASQTKSELNQLKQLSANLSDKKLAAIKYWDAGAPAYRWNQIAGSWSDLDYNVLMRIPTAWINIAIYNATVLAWQEKVKHKRKRPVSLDPNIIPSVNVPNTYSYPCEHTVTAATAAYMLAYFFPTKADTAFQLAHAAAQSRLDAGVQFPSDIDAAWKLGEQVAKAIIEKAKNDGSANIWDGKKNTDPKKWTGPFPLGIMIKSFVPIILRSADQFRPAAPPDFETEMEELKNFKQTFNSRYLAYYWAQNGGLEFWSDVAGIKMFEYHMHDDAPSVARIYAVMHTAFHDAMIAIFDAKYTYWGIRPIQYDTLYRPLIMTPPFPGYPSGHAAGGGTTSAVLSFFFPADAPYFQQMAQDCANSRFYGGIHFKSDNEVGLRMGKEIGKYITETWMKK